MRVIFIALLPVLITLSVADSDLDGSDDDGDRLPPAPRWFQHYANLTKDKDREAKWMEASLRWFDSLFAQIYAVSARASAGGANAVAAMGLFESGVDAVVPAHPVRRRSQLVPRRAVPRMLQTEGKGGEDADAVKTDSDPDHRVVISKLEEATTNACTQFLERVRECRSRTRPDILKHLVQMFDLKFLQSLNPLTTGASLCGGTLCLPTICA
jgi:hypothetical protein